MKRGKKTKTRKGSKGRKAIRRAKPKSVWNPLRKLENYLRKADLQANVFMECLNELRDVIAFEIKADFIKRLCNSVHGDLLSALWVHGKKMEEEQPTDSENREAVAILSGVLEVLMKHFDLRPYKLEGERFPVTGRTAKDYEFDEIPENLGDEKGQKVEVEVLRCGWKVGEKAVQKPRVFEV